MKITHTVARVAVIAAVLFCLMEGSALAASNPIPGVDIIVRKNPGGIPIHATTDKTGNFVFSNLAVGTYQLQVVVPQTKASINTTRSNIKHPSRSIENEVEVFNMSVTLGTEQPAPVEIEITQNGGKIVGSVDKSKKGEETAEISNERVAGGIISYLMNKGKKDSGKVSTDGANSALQDVSTTR